MAASACEGDVEKKLNLYEDVYKPIRNRERRALESGASSLDIESAHTVSSLAKEVVAELERNPHSNCQELMRRLRVAEEEYFEGKGGLTGKSVFHWKKFADAITRGPGFWYVGRPRPGDLATGYEAAWGGVYCITAPRERPGQVKIGVFKSDPGDESRRMAIRVGQVRRKLGLTQVENVLLWKGSRPDVVERALHDSLRPYRVTGKADKGESKEWFAISVTVVMRLVGTAARKRR
jgi:hypothetical protein